MVDRQFQCNFLCHLKSCIFIKFFLYFEECQNYLMGQLFNNLLWFLGLVLVSGWSLISRSVLHYSKSCFLPYFSYIWGEPTIEWKLGFLPKKYICYGVAFWESCLVFGVCFIVSGLITSWLHWWQSKINICDFYTITRVSWVFHRRLLCGKSIFVLSKPKPNLNADFWFLECPFGLVCLATVWQ